MADTTALKNRIRTAIKANDNQEITGPVLQQTLLDVVDELNGATETEAQQRQNDDSTERQQRQSGDNALQQAINTKTANSLVGFFSKTSEEIAPNTDLNNITTAGVYRSKDSSVTSTLLNVPSWVPNNFILHVVVSADDFIVQTVYHGATLVSVRGKAGSNQWSDWRNSSTELDEISTTVNEIKDKTRKYVLTNGTYSSPSIAVSSVPAEYRKECMELTFKSSVFNNWMTYRHTGGSLGPLSSWVLVPDNLLSSAGGNWMLATGDDLNNYTTEGCWTSQANAVTESLLNKPNGMPSKVFKIVVIKATPSLGNSHYIMQMIIMPYTSLIYYRTIVAGGTWSDWYKVPKNLDDLLGIINTSKIADFFNPNCANIPSSSDLNNYTTPGLYRSADSSITATLTNVPSWIPNNFILHVIKPHADFCIQVIYHAATLVSMRGKAGSSANWSSWQNMEQFGNTISDSMTKKANNILVSSFSLNNSCFYTDDDISNNNAFTVVAEFETGEDVSSNQTIWNSSKNGDGTILRIIGGTLTCGLRSASLQSLITAEPNTRYKIAISNNGRVYVNGVVSLKTVGGETGTEGFIIGARRARTTEITEVFKGKIYAVKIANSNLSDLSDSDYKNTIESSVWNYVYLCPSGFNKNKLMDSNASSFYLSKMSRGSGTVTLNIFSSDLSNHIINQDNEISAIKNELNSLKTTVGTIRVVGSSSPAATSFIGDVNDVFKHFKLGLVKDGVLQYFTNQTKITEHEDGLIASCLDGTDGDLLIVNDVDIYYLIYPTDSYDLKLFSLTPFSYMGVTAKCIHPRGDAPGACYIDNINTILTRSPEAVQAALGSGKIHYCRKATNAGLCYQRPMQFVTGRYVPTESGGAISYSFDENGSYAGTTAESPLAPYWPSTYSSLRCSERAALNKNTGDEVIYTNRDLLSREILLSMITAELGTKYYFAPTLFGGAWSAFNNATAADAFENGTVPCSGIRFKNANDEWEYKNLNDAPFDEMVSNEFLYNLLTDWFSPWEIMEQHLVVDYAVKNSIAPNTWFVYNTFEYKYLNVPGCKGLSDGIMTCVILKKHRCKLQNVTYNGDDLTGNDIEFLIASSLYRGWIIDNSPQTWLTGINVVCTNSEVRTYVQHNYKKYLMDKSYGADETIIRGAEVSDINTILDFEKTYKLASVLPNTAYAFNAKTVSKDSIFVPQITGGGFTAYECCCFEPDQVGNRGETYPAKLPDDKKLVTGVKNGYGAYSGNSANMNFLYMNHPRTDTVARTCCSAFVCQKVEI